MVSIAMTCYNSKKFIKNAIDSIIVQTYTNWEIIIVDDASTDGTPKFIKKYVKKKKLDDKVKLIRFTKNRGYGASLKKAVESGSGELIAIVDSDDALNTKRALAISVKAHKKNPKVALTYSNYIICNKRLKMRGPRVNTIQIPKGKKYFRSGIHISHFKMFKREFYQKTDGINPVLKKAVDKDLVLKIEEVGKLLHIPKVLYKYRKHPNSLSKIYRDRGPLGKKAREYRRIIYDDVKKRRQS